jgi:hypothetical protein
LRASRRDHGDAGQTGKAAENSPYPRRGHPSYYATASTVPSETRTV